MKRDAPIATSREGTLGGIPGMDTTQDMLVRIDTVRDANSHRIATILQNGTIVQGYLIAKNGKEVGISLQVAQVLGVGRYKVRLIKPNGMSSSLKMTLILRHDETMDLHKFWIVDDLNQIRDFSLLPESLPVISV